MNGWLGLRIIVLQTAGCCRECEHKQFCPVLVGRGDDLIFLAHTFLDWTHAQNLMLRDVAVYIALSLGDESYLITLKLSLPTDPIKCARSCACKFPIYDLITTPCRYPPHLSPHYCTFRKHFASNSRMTHKLTDTRTNDDDYDLGHPWHPYIESLLTPTHACIIMHLAQHFTKNSVFNYTMPYKRKVKLMGILHKAIKWGPHPQTCLTKVRG